MSRERRGREREGEGGREGGWERGEGGREGMEKEGKRERWRERLEGEVGGKGEGEAEMRKCESGV